MRNRHRHAIEQASCRWRGGRLGDSARTRRKILISTQVAGLPKTRSGKIMRRILRKVAAAEEDQLGDVTTLADPSVVPLLIAKVKQAQGRA